MNPRERILAISIVGLLAVWGGMAVVRNLIIKPFAQQREDIKNQRAQLGDYELQSLQLANVRKDWKDSVGRTLGRTAETAQRAFREDLSKLLEKHGFASRELSIKNYQARAIGKRGLVEVPVQITTRGKLKDLVGFLLDFERRSYFGKVDRVSVSADPSAARTTGSGRRNRNRNKPDRDGPDLKLTIQASTIVLPKLDKDEKFASMSEVGEDDGDLDFPLEEYARIAKANLFAKYVPVVKTPPRGPETKVVRVPGKQPEEKRPPPPPPNPRKDADKFTLVATTSLGGEIVAHVRDERKRGDGPDYFKINQKLDDGVILLIHPRGLVLRSTGGEEQGQDFFYKLGRNFKERELLDESKYPDVARDLRVAISS